MGSTASPRDEALIRQLYVRVDGTSLEPSMMNEVYRAEVASNLHLPNMCTLWLHDQAAEWTNNGPFSLGAELVMGVGDEQGRGDESLFEGEIVSIEPEFGDGTVVDLCVRAYDRSHRLHRGAHTATYANMSDSDIVSQIASEVGLQADVDASSPAHEHVYQDGLAHMAFLQARARRIGYDLYVSGRTLYFKREATQGGSPIQLEWGQQLKSFCPTLSLGAQVSEVQVRGWDPAQKQAVIGVANRGQLAPAIGEQQSGGQSAESAFGAASDLAVSQGAANQGQADALAQAIYDGHDGRFVTAEGVCFGQPQIKAGCTVELSSLGTRFNGRYRVTSATHVWDTESDYVTHFEVSGRGNGTWQEMLLPEEQPTTRWHAMVGIVTNNDDPQGQGRVRVRLPWLNDDLESAWARVVGLGAGNERGLMILPEVNDEVLVVFAQGEIDHPIVVGGVWNGQDAPPVAQSEVVVNGNVQQRLFKTRAGHLLLFSDQGDALIRIETAGGHTLVLHDDEAKIEIATSNGNTITLDDNGRTISIQGVGDIALEANQNLSIKASGNMDLEATGNMTIKGATIQLNP